VRDGPGAAHEEREGRTRCTTDHGTGTTAFGVAAREFECVNVVDERQGEWLAEFGRRRSTGFTVESPSHDETGAADHERFDDRHDEEVEHEVAPETAGMGGSHVDVVAGEVIDDRVERRQDVKDEQRDHREPDPAPQSAIQDARRNEAGKGVGVFESIRVGTVSDVSALRVDGASARGDGQIANAVGRSDVQDQVTRHDDAESFQALAGLLVLAQFAVVTSRQDEEPVSHIGVERDDLVAQRGQGRQRGVDESDEVRGRFGVEEIARDDDDGRVVDVAQEVDELLDRTALLVGGGRE
jgi:hypothetical protein